MPGTLYKCTHVRARPAGVRANEYGFVRLYASDVFFYLRKVPEFYEVKFCLLPVRKEGLHRKIFLTGG